MCRTPSRSRRGCARAHPASVLARAAQERSGGPQPDLQGFGPLGCHRAEGLCLSDVRRRSNGPSERSRSVSHLLGRCWWSECQGTLPAPGGWYYGLGVLPAPKALMPGIPGPSVRKCAVTGRGPTRSAHARGRPRRDPAVGVERRRQAVALELLQFQMTEARRGWRSACAP